MINMLHLTTLFQYMILNLIIWISFSLIIHYDALLWEMKNVDYLIYCGAGEKFVSGIISTILAYYLNTCLLYTSDAADDMQCVDLGGRRIIKKKKKKKEKNHGER
eukprot:TRINITY_DN8294_c0_g1_i1.p2 TRINITY_DN8294_c0_g1~~TRINITY_DN8294_c0_g1_i1.p2  ORF type:complete len:105 (-),score=22.71 TRINITY_DN8294_c0_g1_i1:59-373(-)